LKFVIFIECLGLLSESNKANMQGFMHPVDDRLVHVRVSCIRNHSIVFLALWRGNGRH